MRELKTSLDVVACLLIEVGVNAKARSTTLGMPASGGHLMSLGTRRRQPAWLTPISRDSALLGDPTDEGGERASDSRVGSGPPPGDVCRHHPHHPYIEPVWRQTASINSRVAQGDERMLSVAAEDLFTRQVLREIP